MKVFLCAGMTLLLLLACSKQLTVEQQVIATLRNMEVAAEAGEHLEFIGYVAVTFTAQHGSMARRDFHRFMIYQINQHRRQRAQFFPIYVTDLGNDQAAAQFQLLVTGGAGLLPESGQLYEVQTRWIRDGSEWMLEGAEWEPVYLPDIPRPSG